MKFNAALRHGNYCNYRFGDSDCNERSGRRKAARPRKAIPTPQHARFALLNSLRSYTIMATASTSKKRLPAMASFREQINAQMKKKQLTHTEVAKESGISRAYLYRILDGQQTPSMKVADKIADALGLVITTRLAR